VRKPTARRYGPDASRFENLGSVLDRMAPPRCTWDDCRDSRYMDMPVCATHAVMIYGIVKRDLGVPSNKIGRLPPSPPRKNQPFVYYLMIGPSTVKIGTTMDLLQRLSQLRSEPQYVVGLERGGRELERQRHKQFADERRSRREDFRLSDRLKKHIDELAPNRDELIKLATACPLAAE